MSQATDLITALKAHLRRSGLGYAELARRLSVSESTIKRSFATGHFSLERLTAICDIAGIELAELAAQADERRRDVVELDEEQERTLVRDPKLLLLAFLLFNDWRLDEVLANYRIGELEAVQLLAQLDRLKIIDLMPGNRVRMRLSRRFNWRSNGPIQRFFEKQVQSEFFSSRFDRPGELRLVLHGMLSDQSLNVLHQRLERLAEDFEARVREDRALTHQQRLGTSAVLAIRPWNLSMFEALRREP